MKVLFLAPLLPYPPRSGAAIRNLNLIRGLAQHHEVTLLAFADRPAGPTSARPPGRDAERAAPPELLALCREVVAVDLPARSRPRRLFDLLLPPPDLARRLASPAMAKAARTLAAQRSFDVVHVGGLEMAEVGLALRGRAAVVLDEHNAEYVLQRRAFENELRLGGSPVGALYSLVQWWKLRRYEARACRLADGVMAVSEADGQALLALAAGIRLAVVPNSVDTQEYSPRPRPPGGPPTLVFTGKMDFRPNVDAVVWFCREALPLVRAEAPDVRFRIVGRDPTEVVRRLGRLPGVEVVGAVADDRPYVAGAHVFVVPMRVGGGVRIKVLQAMAAGAPVVSTTLGLEGIAARPGEHLLVADRPADFARAVLGLLASPKMGARLARAARRLVEAGYDWRVLAPRVEAFYEATVEARRATFVPE